MNDAHAIGCEPNASCPLCNTPGVGPVRTHPDFPGSFLFRCEQCQHLYCAPEPDAATLEHHYQSAYGEKRRAYFGRQYRAIMKKRAKAQSELIAQWATPGCCIDIGCGIGALVAELSKRGWSARGLDSDKEAIAFGRRLFDADLSTASPEESVRDGPKPDLLCLSHVVEHLRDLQGALASLANLLPSGGTIFVEVPNDRGAPGGDLESHLHFFSRQSLMLTMQAAGFEILVCACCGPLHAASSQPAASLYGRILNRARREIQNLFGATDWDGWYNRYHAGDDGLWIRCIARRSK